MRILNVGSLNIDHVYSVEHIVTPGETAMASAPAFFCGGKGLNQTIALKRAGADVTHAGRIGTDGKMLTDFLSESGLSTESIVTDEEQPTGHAVIQVDAKGQNAILVCGGANTAFTEAELDGMLEPFGKGDLLLVQNETNVTQVALKKAKEKGMRTALNPSPMGALAGSDALSFVDIFVLNEIEGEQLTGENDPEKICAALLGRYPDSAVMLTLGEDGCLYAEGELRIRQARFEVKAEDTTAAGDTFLGYFLAGLAAEMPMERILRRASRAAAIAVSRKGAAPSIPYASEIMD